MIERLKRAADIGEQMLLSGGEVHRVEDSVIRMCRALGAERVDCFIITSSIVVTVTDSEGNTHTVTRRINSTGTDFTKLSRLNDLSRRICSGSVNYEDVDAEYEKIINAKPYSFLVEFIAYAFIAGAFTLFFGGNLVQFFVSFFIGGLTRFAVYFSDITVKNTIFAKFLSSFFVTAAAFFAVRLGITPSADEVIIGNIMLLIPGLGFTNALRDLFVGDSIAGVLRSIEALLSAVGIAAGYFLFVLIAGGVAV
jgi:uncharacterized membrane protein YjjP (DUF1212 family)